MTQQHNRNWQAALVVALIAAAAQFGCKSTRSDHPGKAATRTEATRPADTDHAAATHGSWVEGEHVYAVGYYPTGHKGSSAVVVHRKAPHQVRVDQSFDIELKVTNLTKNPLHDVVVTGKPDKGFKIASSSPEHEGSGEQVHWSLGNLGPRETKQITISGSASQTGDLVDCVTLAYTPYTCLAITVIEPKLQLTKEMTPEVLRCEPIEVRYVVTNPGTGPAKDVVVTDELPDGLITAKEKSKTLTARFDVLKAGESKSFKAALIAQKTGQFTNNATVNAAGGLSAKASAKTVVLEPKLDITKTGPEKQFIGRSVTYQIKVTNTGDGEARKTVVEDTIPAGVSFVSATEGGAMRGGKVSWDLGTLAPNDSKSLSVTITAGAAGELKNAASARAFCAEPVAATASTTITGIPAILLEVIDDIDPVEVGTETTYTITVTNQGTAPDTNIKITCTLDESQSYVKARGNTPGKAAGRTITFEPLPTLKPKERATWVVTVKADKQADSRFRVVMTTDQLTRPVEETEATNLYQ